MNGCRLIPLTLRNYLASIQFIKNVKWCGQVHLSIIEFGTSRRDFMPKILQLILPKKKNQTNKHATNQTWTINIMAKLSKF